VLAKRIYLALARIPGLGRLVRIAAAIYRLPEFRAYETTLTAQVKDAARVAEDATRKAHANAIRMDALRASQAAIEASQAAIQARLPSIDALEAKLPSIDALEASVAEIARRQQAIEDELLPSLQRTVSAIDQRQVAADEDAANLTKSVPVALRRLARAQHDLDAQLAGLGGLPARVAALDAALAELRPLEGRARVPSATVEDATEARASTPGGNAPAADSGPSGPRAP